MRRVFYVFHLVCLVITSALADVDRSEVSAGHVELFAAREAGQLDVKLIPKDSTESMVIIENKTEGPLQITLPETFAGVPVLAQRVGGGVGGGLNVGGGGGAQGIGGGIGGGGIGGAGGGVFSVGPDSVRKIQVTTVCLEHGKDEPKPKIAYEMKPIETLTQDRNVIELVKMLANGEIDQPSAQAAAWHLTDDLSWDQLLSKVKAEHLNGSRELYFNPQQVARAVAIVGETRRRVSEGDVSADLETTKPARRPQAYDQYRSGSE